MRSARRIPPAEYLSLELRAHELLRGVPLYDVTAIDLPGGGAGRTIADVQALDSSAPPSRMAKVLYRTRRLLGRVFGWDRVPMRPEDSLLSRLSERDLRESEIVPGTRDSGFLVLYRFPHEALSEIRNATVRGWICLALAPIATGYRLYLAVYVVPVSRLTKPYLIAIEPFRRFLLYPAMLRRIRRAWLSRFGSS